MQMPIVLYMARIINIMNIDKRAGLNAFAQLLLILLALSIMVMVMYFLISYSLKLFVGLVIGAAIANLWYVLYRQNL